MSAIQVDTRGAVAAMNLALPEARRRVELADREGESPRAIKVGAKPPLERLRDVATATRKQSAASTLIAQFVV